jgi:outer membrane protein insertion porin family
MRMKLLTLLTLTLLGLPAESREVKPPRVLKFTGVPMSQGAVVKKRFPFVFEREVTLAEVDEVVRFLMKSGLFAGVEVVEKDGADGRELVLQASLLRKINDIKVEGNSALPTSDILRILSISKGQTFERKDLLASSEDLRKAYDDLGYHNAKVEIEFDVPNDNEVGIAVRVQEGAPVRVSEIVIDTPNPELTSRITRMAKSYKKRILTEDELLDFQNTVQTWLQDNRYLTARLSSPAVVFNKERTQARLAYTIENPWRFEFRMEGNKYFSDSSIIRQLESEKLSGAVSSPAPDMAEKVRRMYQAVGFANIEITYTDVLDESKFRQLIRFTIKEGPRVRIGKIEISGNVSRPEEYYAGFIKSSSSDLIGSGFYNRKDIDEGSRKLITELQNQGYLRARILSQRAEYSKDRSSVVIVLNIDEGPLTQIRQIRVEGANSFPKAQILEMLSIRSGAALGLRELEDSIQTIKNFYRSEGFLEMKILNENERSRIVTYNEANTQATVEFQIYEGPRVIVGSIATQGNSFTKDEVIVRELAFKTGDVLTTERMEDSIFNLQRLGLFSRVSIRMLEEGTNISERTLIVEVEERDPGLVTFGFGLNNDRDPRYLILRGYLGVGYRNINGTGRGISFRIDPRYSTDPRISYVEHTITLSYLEPYIFNDRNRGRINLVREQRFDNFESLGGDQTGRTVMLEENAIGLLLERDLTRNIKLTYTGYSFSNQRKFDRVSYDTLELQNIAKTGPMLEFDFRDDAFNPSKGSYSLVNLEYSDPMIGSSRDQSQTIHFMKANASLTQYRRVAGRQDFVWANSIRAGYLVNLSTDAVGGVPSQEAFFLGGRATIRGFDPGNENERIPPNYELGVDDLRQFRVTDDSYFYLLKTELRFPIWKQLGGAVFYDGGAVLLSQPGIRLADPYRDSVGLGLRIGTPVGPLNFEIGWKLDRRLIQTGTNGQPDRRESPWAFHFSIGTF